MEKSSKKTGAKEAKKTPARKSASTKKADPKKLIVAKKEFVAEPGKKVPLISDDVTVSESR